MYTLKYTLYKFTRYVKEGYIIIGPRWVALLVPPLLRLPIVHLSGCQPTYLLVGLHLPKNIPRYHLVVLRYLGRVKCQVVVPPRQQPAAADGRYFVPLHFQFVYLFLLVLSVSLLLYHVHTFTHTHDTTTYLFTNKLNPHQTRRERFTAVQSC